MNVLVFGQGKTGTTVISKAIHHSIAGAKFLMEPKSEVALSDVAGRDTVVKILHGQWQMNLPGLTRILRNQSVMRFDRIVKVIRDPRDQAISFVFYNFYYLARSGKASDSQLKEMIGIVQEKERAPASISFTAFCAEINRVLEWDGFTSRWLLMESGLTANREYWDYLNTVSEFGYLMRYENFMRGELEGLESYLGVKLSANREVGEFSRIRRTASWGNWREFFTSEDVEVLRPLTGSMLEEMGYADWRLTPVEQLKPEYFSGYLVKLVREAQEEA